MIPEEWRPIPGFDPRYEVSSRGRVRSWIRPGRGIGRLEAPRILKGTPHHNGYPIYGLRTADGRFVSKYAHQLVGAAFIGPLPKGLVTRHKNGDPMDNRLENLTYGTHGDNHADREEHGHTARGAAHGRTKLTEDDVLDIVRSYQTTAETQMSLANRYGVGQTTISGIVRGETWGDVTGLG